MLRLGLIKLRSRGLARKVVAIDRLKSHHFFRKSITNWLFHLRPQSIKLHPQLNWPSQGKCSHRAATFPSTHSLATRTVKETGCIWTLRPPPIPIPLMSIVSTDNRSPSTAASSSLPWPKDPTAEYLRDL
mmetsp:Transcript_4478/g.10542  ORF Transcript_4478/g.10542 Transcript_4478/m.10542 type:complete len:130 (-) Transcript_4478:103-492(-)